MEAAAAGRAMNGVLSPTLTVDSLLLLTAFFNRHEHLNFDSESVFQKSHIKTILNWICSWQSSM